MCRRRFVVLALEPQASYAGEILRTENAGRGFRTRVSSVRTVTKRNGLASKERSGAAPHLRQDIHGLGKPAQGFQV